MIDDPKKFQKMVDESGYGEALKNPKEVQAIVKEMQDFMRDEKTIEQDVYRKNAALMEKLNKVVD